MANSCNHLKVISECYVKPENDIEATKINPFHLNPVDLGFLTLTHMQRGLLFTNQPENMQSFLENLKKSLSICLVEFYSLAGEFTTVKFPDENAKGVYVDCNKGDGARLIHATARDVSVRDMVSSVDVPTIVRYLFDLGVKAVNYDGHSRPLLSIQVTELLDEVFIGFTMNHSVGDGTSLWHFISSLSEVCVQLMENQENNKVKDTVISRKPMFKQYTPKGHGPIIKMTDHDVDDSITRSENDPKMFRVRTFHFSSKSISSLKAKANTECEGKNTISSFQALSAFVWRSITRARNLDYRLETSCALVINARPRFNPPISSDYFGNYITREQTTCTVGELLGNGLGWAANLVHKLVASQDDKTVGEFYEKIIKFLCGQNDIGPLFCNPNLVLMRGSMRFDMYGPDFGLGKAEGVYLGDCNRKDGKVTASPGREGDGSVDLEVCLKSEIMNALETDEEFRSFSLC